MNVGHGWVFKRDDGLIMRCGGPVLCAWCAADLVEKTKREAHQAGRGGWIGVDLDGTLAEYGGWTAEDEFGAPIMPMVNRVKAWLAEGKEVRIVTARAYAGDEGQERDIRHIIVAIQDWTEKHTGARLRVQAHKDFNMIALWDDRAVQIIPNTGLRADGVA